MGDDDFYATPKATISPRSAPPSQIGVLTRVFLSALCAACSVIYILIKLRVTAEFKQLGIEPAGLCGLLMAKATIALHLTLIPAAWIPYEVRFGTRYLRPQSVAALCFAVSLSMTVVALFAPIIQVIEDLGRHA